MSRRIADLLIKIGADSYEFQQKAQQVEKGLDSLTKRLDKVGKEMSLKVTAPLTALGVASLAVTSKFDEAMREVSTLSDGITQNFKGFNNEIITLTKRIPIGATDAAKALYQIVSAGHDGANGMKVLEVAAKAAVAGVTDTATVADAITTLLNAYGLSAENADKLSDQLFTTVRLGKTTFGELGSNISTVAATAASFGIKTEEVLAAVATLTKMGVPTGQAMTQIRSAIVATADVMGDGAFKGRTFQEAMAKMASNAGGSFTALKNDAGRIEALVAKGWKFTEVLDFVSQKVSEVMRGFDESLNKFLVGSVEAAAEAIGQMLAGDLGFDGLMKAILLQLAGFLKSIGSQLIQFGVMIIAFKTALKSVLANPWAAIAVGAAMVAAAAIMTALINKNAQKSIPVSPEQPPKLAKGGLAYGPTYAMVGDNPNASVDPEVIAPLSKLKSMMTGGGTQNIQIALSGQLTAKGRDLVYVLGKENFKIEALAG